MSHRFVWMLSVGTACGALGCSDPVPAASAAGLNMSIGICPTQGMPRASLGNPAPTRQSTGKPIFSGESGVSVSCSVRGEGTFTISGDVRTPSLSFAVNGTANAADKTGTALVRIYTPGIGEHVSQQNCPLQILQIQKGAVWAGFTCSSLHYPPNLNCNASGEFLLERCSE